jgi:anti-sigma factor RsiW
MSCEIARHLRETDDPGLDEHQQSCPSCIVQAHARYYEAPAGLEDRIRRSLRKESGAGVNWRWAAIAASVLLTASVVWNIVLVASRVDSRRVLAEDVVSAHIRSLEGNHLLDEPSSDQHNVKPWFNGKLDFAPDVKEVSGFPLLGGRLEYFDGHAAAALVYGRREHKINLLTWPSAEVVPEITETVSGYHLQGWSRNGMVFWVVSDLNAGELGQFAALYRGN